MCDCINVSYTQRETEKATQQKFVILPVFQTHRSTLRTRIVAGELMTESFRFRAASISGGSSLGFEDADVAVFVSERKKSIRHGTS